MYHLASASDLRMRLALFFNDIHNKMISERVLRSAMASKLAYAEDIRALARFPVSSLLHGRKSENGKIIDCKRSGAHAYIWQTGENSQIVSFRGSTTMKDVCRFINTELVPFNYCDNTMRVHHVVHTMFASIEKEITESLNLCDNLNDQQNITLCGHSLGGALAMFAAAYFANMTNGRHNIICHTFGAPKVGDESFTQWYEYWVHESVHLKNKYDFLAEYPFWGYSDASTIIRLGNNPSTLFEALSNHDLDTYIRNVTNACYKRCPH